MIKKIIALFHFFSLMFSISMYASLPVASTLVATQQVAVTHQSARAQLMQSRLPYCAACLAAWGTYKRQGCNHSFCDVCFTSAIVAECPTCREEANQCSICLELFDNSVRTLICGHMFCASCIGSWQASQTGPEQESTCPTCRQPLIFKDSMRCEICNVAFKNNDEVTPSLVCKLTGWASWREKYVCIQQFAHRFHDKCFNQHYIRPGNHVSDLREHICVCPIHPIYQRCQEHPNGCGPDDHPVGRIKLPHIVPDRGGPQAYVEYAPGSIPNSSAPSPRTLEKLEDIVNLEELVEVLLGSAT